MVPNEKMMYAIKEVAGFLGVGRDTVRRWIRNDALRAVELPKAGGKGRNKTFRIPGSEVIRMMAA